MKINQTLIKQEFKKENIQLGANTLDLINYALMDKVRAMVNNCKDGNVKRLTTELFYIALGRLNNG